MAKLPSLDGVSTSEARCIKPGCGAQRHVQRHHKRHQAMWCGIWARIRRGEPHFRQFVQRYHQFHKDDVADLCRSHHAEIHSIYDTIIALDKARLGIPLPDYSWKQAEALMDRLEQAFNDWIKVETPGIDSDTYSNTRQLWRKMLKNGAPRRRA